MRVRVEGEGEWEFPDDATEGEIAVAINGERGLGPRGVPEFAGRPAGFQPETSGPALLPRSGPDLRPEAARSRPAFSAGLGVPIAQPVEPPAGSPPAAVAPPPAAGTLPAGGSTLRPGSLVPQNPFAPRPNPMRTALAGMQAAAGAPLAAFGPEAIQAAGAAAAPPLPRTEGPSAFEGTPAALGAGVVDVARSVTAMPRVAARLGEGLADAVLGEAAGALVRKLGAIAPQRVVGDFLDEKLLKPATEFYEGNEGMRRDAREAPLSEKLQEPGWAARQAVRQLPQLAAALATAGAGPAAGAAGKGGTLLSRVLAGAAATGKQIAAPAVLEAGETTRNLEEEEARTGQRLDNLRFGTAVAGKGVAAGALELAGAEAILGKLAKYAPDAVKRRLGKAATELLTGSLGEGLTERAQNLVGNFAEMMAKDPVSFRELFSRAKTGEFWDALDKGGAESQFLGSLVGTGAGAVRAGVHQAQVRGRAADIAAARERAAQRQGAPAAPTAEVPPTLEGIGSDLARQLALDEAQRATLKRAQEAIASGDGEAALAAISDVLALPSALPAPLPSARAEAPVTVPTGERARPSPVGGAQEEQARRIVDSIAEHADRVERGDFWRDPLDVAGDEMLRQADTVGQAEAASERAKVAMDAGDYDAAMGHLAEALRFQGEAAVADPRLVRGQETAPRTPPAAEPAAPLLPQAPPQERRKAATPIFDWLDAKGQEIDQDRIDADPLTWSADEARYFGLIDAGTGLPNRKAFDVARKQNPTAREGRIDLDGLKQANDTYGHEVGDTYIETLAVVARQHGLRLARVGGDEFALLYDDEDAAIDERMQRALAQVESTRIPVEGLEEKDYPRHGGFSYGLGSDAASADAAAYADKRARKAARAAPLEVRRDGVGAGPGLPPARRTGGDGGPESGGAPGAPPAGSAPLPPPVAPAAPAARSATPNPAPREGVLTRTGREGEAFTADGERVGVKWAVADAFEDLVPSHEETGAGDLRPNAAFAQVLQPRDRGRAASEQQVDRISREIRPGALGESYYASDGAPIVGPDRLVESGNGRTLAVRRAYQTGRAEEYRRWLEEHAGEFGLTADQVREVKAPMLVRVRTTPTADRAELVKKFNVATVAKMSAAETARADADRLTPELLARFQPSEDGLAILAARNRDFVSGFFATVPENEKSELLDEDGQLNKDGRKRIENALLGKAYGKAPILERITEATDDNARLVSGALLNAAPAMATLKGAIDAGDVRADVDPTPAIVEAVQKLSWLRDEGGTVESYLQQQGLFADEMTPAGREVLKAFDTFKRSGKKLTSFLTAVAESAILEGDARQTDLFADAPPARLEDIVRAARRFAADGGQGGLFSGGEGLPLAPPDGPGPGGVPGGRSDGAVDRPRVSLAAGRGAVRADPRHVLLVERYARRLSAGWSDAPKILVVPDVSGLPEDIVARAESFDALGGVDGVYTGASDDRVFLVASALRSREDVERVVLHEVMGHAGLRRLIGRDEYGSLMDRIADSLPRDVEAKARAYGLDLTDRDQRQEAADEVLAEWASRPEAPPRAITRAIVALRGMLRRIFPSLRWTPDDVRALLARARRRVEEGESGKRTTEAPRFSRAADGEKRVQITELEGREFTTGERGVFLRARAWARANISGKDFLNRDTGLQIAVGRNAIDKMLSESATEKSRWPWHVEAIRSVPELIERAVLVEEGGDARGNDDFRSLRRFVAPLSTPDGVFRVKLTVKEYAGAKPGLYTYELTEVEVPGAGPRHQVGPHPITSRAGHDGDQGAVADMSLAELMGEGAAQDIRFSRAFDDEAPTEAEERVYRSLVERARERAGEAARAAERVREELADPGDILEARRDPELPTHSREIQNHIRPAGRKADVEPLLNQAEDAYQQLARRHYAVEKTSQRLGADRGPAHLDPGVVYELSAGHSARAEQMLEGNGGFRLGRNGEIEWTGNKAFSKILSALGPGRLNELRRYLVARRAIELHHRAPRQQGLLGDDQRTIYSGISEAAAQQEVAGAPEDVKRAAEEVTALLDDALRYWAEAGGLSAEAVETIRDLNRSYVPFYRVFEGDDPARRSGRLVLPAQRGTALQAEQAVKKIWGGGADILDPLVAVADHIQRMIRAADINRVGKALVEAAALNPEAAQGLVEEVTQPTTDPDATREGTAVQDSAGAYGVEVNDEAAAAISFLSDKKMSFANDRIRVWKDGKLREYRVEKSIGDSLRALGPQDVKLLAKILSFPAQALREGVTKNPIFSLFNFLRDTGDASVQSTNGFRFFLDSTIGLAEAIRNGDLRKEWLAAGGGYSTLSGGGIRGAENALKEIAPKTTLQSTLWTLRHPLDLLGRLNRPFEEAARLGEYRLARQKGKSATEAALDSARITTNFTVHGSDAFCWAWLKASAFANPALQGADRAFRTVLEAPRGQKQTPQRALAAAANVVFKGLLNVGTLSALFYLLGDDDDEIKELRRTRAGATWWFARVPGTGVIVRFPKPFLWGQVFGTGIEAAIDRAKGENPRAFKEWRQEVLDMVWDGGVPIPSAMKLLGELSTNRSTFFQRPIVNRQLEGVEARYQANPSTSQVARKVGDVFNVAPAKVDYAIGSLTGSLGREAVRAGDLLLRDGSVSPPAPRLGDLPLVGRAFARTPDISNDSTETFYDELGKVREAVKTMKLLRKQDPEEARRRAPEYRRALLAERAYEATAERLADLRKAIERTNKAPDTTYSREEKRKRVDFLAVRMTDLARRVVDRRLLEERAR